MVAASAGEATGPHEDSDPAVPRRTDLDRLLGTLPMRMLPDLIGA